ncbi:germin-like protein [Silene latifolia]|uniref:germin-like protein n=1 Tax=Silene latifolia TaxID=37657 RepID=UPI003D787417
MTFYMVYAADPPPLQDFCVGLNDPNFPVTINGLFCKNPKDVTSTDFLFQGFNTIGNTNNRFGSAPSMVNATRFPALNTLGISMGRVDYAPGGLNPPHFHPRAAEMFTVLEGTLFVGFISSNLPNETNRLFSTVLNKGDIFVIPQSLIHFQLNIGGTHAVHNSAFGSQNPGRIGVADSIFGSNPDIPDDVLTTTFQVNERVIQAIRSQFG